MTSIWSYLVVALCVSLTSSALLNPLGNGEHRHSDESRDVREEKTKTPPTSPKVALMESSEKICHELCRKGDGGNACMCDWAPMAREIALAMKPVAASWVKYPTPMSEPICKVLCESNSRDHLCSCD